MGWTGNFRKLHYDVLFYYLVSMEMEPLGRHLQVELGNELTDQTLQLFDQYCHEHHFPPPVPSKVTALVGDGHQKVMVKCRGQVVSKRAGRPRTKKPSKRHHGHGWFMLIDPKTGRILAALTQMKPEGNEVAAEALCKILPTYKKVDLFILDRVCAFMPGAKQMKGLQQLKYYSVDRFHALQHRKTCPCHPSKRRLQNRFGHFNTSVAEQTFSWFRSYSTVLNEMRAVRHRFAVLLFCKMHNEMMATNNQDHLNKYSTENKMKRKINSKPYSCIKKKNSKARKVMKSMKAMKWCSQLRMRWKLH